MSTRRRTRGRPPDPVRWVGGRFAVRLRLPGTDERPRWAVVWAVEDSSVVITADIVELTATSEETAQPLVDALADYAGERAEPVGGLVVQDQDLADMVRPHVSDRYHVEVEHRWEPYSTWAKFRAALGHNADTAPEFLRWRGPRVTRFLTAASKLYRHAPWSRPADVVANLEIVGWDVACSTNPTSNVVEDGEGILLTFLPTREQEAAFPGHASLDLMVVSFMDAPGMPPDVAARLTDLGFDVPNVVPLLGIHRGIDVACPPTERDFDVAYALCEGLDRMLDMGPGHVSVDFVADELPGKPEVAGDMVW